MATNTQSEFYRKKQENEKLLMEAEFHLKHDAYSIVKNKNEIIKSIISLPFQTDSLIKNSSTISLNENPNNIISNGLKIYRSLKEISHLAKQILQQFKK